MKKLLLLTFGLIVGSMGFAQNIPNGNFELSLTNGWNATSGVGGISTTTSVPSFKSQTKALTLTTYSASTVYSASVSASFSVSVSSVDVRPKTLTGFVKYVPAGTDVAEISVTLLKAGNNIGGVQGYTISATPTTTVSAGFVSINVPLTYTNTTDLPDSIQIFITSSQNASVANVGSVLSVDNLRFLSCTPDPSITLTSVAVSNPATSVKEFRLNSDSRAYTQVFTKAIRNPAYIAIATISATISPLDSVIWDPITFPANSTLSYIPGHPSGVSYGNSVYCYKVAGNLPPTYDTAFVLVNKNTAYGVAHILFGTTPYTITLPATTPTNTSHQPNDSLTFVFGTPDSLATVTTTAATAITNVDAISGGNVTFDGHDANTTRGICYSTSVKRPTIADSTVAGGTGAGTYTVSLTGLTPSTKYYIRAYATNKMGTAYGMQDSIKTLASAGGSTGVKTITTKGIIQVYPNPSNGVFTISADTEVSNSLVEVYNSLGEKVFKTNIKQLTSATIDLSSFPRGVYYLLIKSNNNAVLNQKIITQ